MQKLDNIGRQIAKMKIEGSTDGQLAETIQFKNLHNAIKQVLNSEGVGSHEADVLRQQFGELISAKLKGSSIGDAFEQLQSSYRPVAEMNRSIKRMFSPSGTIANLTSGENFMKRIANGDMSGVDVGTLRYLERNEVPIPDKPGEFQPSGFGNGLGDVSSEISNMGKKFRDLEQAKKALGDERSARLSSIGSDYAEKLRQLESNGELTQSRLESEKNLMKDKLTAQFAKERMDIELRQQRIDKSLEILQNKKGELKGMTTQQINTIKEQVRMDFIKQRMDLEQRKGINEKQLNKMEARKARINSLEKITNAIGLFGGFRVYRIVRGGLMIKNALRHIKK
jgi:DNA-binding Xre family transcriptional regulator